MGRKAKIHGLGWEFSALMNEAIRSLPERMMQKRNYVYASEIGGHMATRYLRMFAHPYTNPINDRGRRKMLSGTIFEWIVHFVLTVCGVVKESQLKGTIELPGMLPVSGKLDFIAGGQVDWEKATHEAERLRALFRTTIDDMPPIVFYAIDKVLARMQQMFQFAPLQEKVLEIKSVSGFVGDLIERSNKPRMPHPLQCLHYVMANKLPGAIVYINRDSFMCYEFPVEPTKELVKMYHDDVQTITMYYNNAGKNYLKNCPPVGSPVIFEPASFRFVKSNGIEYSPYLTHFFPQYKSFDDFNNAWTKPLSQYNRVFRRCVLGQNMTKANTEIITEAKKTFPDWDAYVEQARKAGAFDKPETDDED